MHDLYKTSSLKQLQIGIDQKRQVKYYLSVYQKLKCKIFMSKNILESITLFDQLNLIQICILKASAIIDITFRKKINKDF